jgi:hypothetical protein
VRETAVDVGAATLRNAITTDPRLVVLWLERPFPDWWHRRQRIETDCKVESAAVPNRVLYVVV